ncbi:unnamed protein product [Acanthocheilonema viteae]|uniref:Uncharacterized protein n=1 Tax=Acanthocheilonema viteae TaxID=6277 RepID=A0A498SFF0_ACAVI|nr:unnamed protein product [Acanthocheilonema viteae]
MTPRAMTFPCWAVSMCTRCKWTEKSRSFVDRAIMKRTATKNRQTCKTAKPIAEAMITGPAHFSAFADTWRVLIGEYIVNTKQFQIDHSKYPLEKLFGSRKRS